MKRFIVDVWDDEEISDTEAFRHILAVMSQGKESETKHGKCYCFGTRFKYSDIMVGAELLKSGTHKFRVYKSN
jgi:hypothetical protein